MNPETKICQNCHQNFTIEPEDFKFYQKISVPPPTWCPECRLIRRLAWRNERSLYNRKCDLCSKQMISVFGPHTGLTVYCSPCWWSDKWDAMDYGKSFNPSQSFLAQFITLFQKVPVMNLFGLFPTLVNSEYTNMVGNLKNCYLITHSDFNENCAYGGFITNSRDSVDNLMVDQCELCYENVNCQKCYRTFFSVDCESCENIYFSKNLIGCSNCFGCANLRHKRYYIFNQPYTKEEYEKEIKKYDVDSHSRVQEQKSKVSKHWIDFPQKYNHERHNHNVTGDYIYNSKNTFNSYIVADVEDSRFCTFVTPGGMTDCYDFTHYGTTASLMYESLQAGNQTSKIFFSWLVASSAHEVEYSMFVIGSKNVFGTVGLKKREYCILNKQYSKEEYQKLRSEIIKNMGEDYGNFFPIKLSPYGYNETTAQEYFPLTKEQAIEKGYSWKDPEPRNYQITLKTADIPDHIKDVKEDILNQIIACQHQGDCNEQCTEAYRIIPQELDFLRKMNLPIPRLCPNCRHYQRIKQRNPLRLWHRQCMCDYKIYKNTAKHDHEGRCPNEFETTYAPERPEIVYCEKCYLKEVV